MTYIRRREKVLEAGEEPAFENDAGISSQVAEVPPKVQTGFPTCLRYTHTQAHASTQQHTKDLATT